MLSSKRVALVAASATMALAGVATPALAAGSGHWSTSKCHSWRSSYLKHNRHASKSSKTAANKLLKAKGCAQRV